MFYQEYSSLGANELKKECFEQELKTPVCFSFPLKRAQLVLKGLSTIRQARTHYVLRFLCRRLLRRRRRLLRRLRRLRCLRRRLLFLKRQPLLLPIQKENHKEMFLQSNWN